MKAAGQDLDKLTKAARSRSFKPVPLALKTSIQFDNKVSRVKTANVAGLLPGSDPKLKDEVVIYSAHHDHFGIGEPTRQATRSTTARRTTPPAARRCWPSRAPSPRCRSGRAAPCSCCSSPAEEQGLLGSKYYSLHPTFAPGKIAANINFDGGNFQGRTKDIIYVGFGKSTLDGIAEALAEKQGRVVSARPVPRPRLLLPLRPVQLRQDRRARDVLQRRHRLHRQA